MLILARRNSESILIGDEVEVTILKVHGNHVQLGINAPRSVSVHRREVYDRIKKKINRAPFLANNLANKKRP